MARNQTYDSGPREWRSDESRSNRWRDQNEGRYGSAAADRDLADDYRFLRHDDGPVGGRPYAAEGTPGRQGGYGGNYGEGRYGEGGSLSRFEMDHSGKGPRNYQPGDERLRERICEALQEHPDIDASDMSVTVHEGRVVLEGEVDSRSTRNRIEDLAERFAFTEVQNNLRVRRQGA